MKITIKTISGKVHQLEDMDADLTVEKLKILAEKQTEIVPDCQRLIFKGKVLKNEQTLADAKLCDGDCIIIVKSRKKKKQLTPEEKKEERNATQASANANVGPTPAQGIAQPNAANPFGFMAGQGQPPVPLNLDAFGALFRGNVRNPFGFQAQSAAANAQQPAASAATNANGPAAENPFAASPFAAMMGQGANNQGLDMNALLQMLQNPMMQEMLRSPAMQQMMQNMMSNPQMLQNMIRNNPRLNGLSQNSGNPATATQPAPAPQPNINPVAPNLNAAPNAASAANAQAAGPNSQPAATNPQAAQPNPLALLMSQLNNQQPNNAATPNLFQGFMNAQQMPQPPPVRQPQGLNDVQAREMYATELGQLQNMGFLDEARNLRALRETAGSVEAAINMLLS